VEYRVFQSCYSILYNQKHQICVHLRSSAVPFYGFSINTKSASVPSASYRQAASGFAIPFSHNAFCKLSVNSGNIRIRSLLNYGKTISLASLHKHIFWNKSKKLASDLFCKFADYILLIRGALELHITPLSVISRRESPLQILFAA